MGSEFEERGVPFWLLNRTMVKTVHEEVRRMLSIVASEPDEQAAQAGSGWVWA